MRWNIFEKSNHSNLLVLSNSYEIRIITKLLFLHAKNLVRYKDVIFNI